MWMLIAVALLAGGAEAPSGEREKLLLGYWECVQRCPDEEIEFSVERGMRRYDSWVHMHPGTSGAEWRLEGAHLTVTRDGGPLYDWIVVKVTNRRLVLRDKDAGRGVGKTVMKRVTVGE
jgi:hypothetical protein